MSKSLICKIGIHKPAKTPRQTCFEWVNDKPRITTKCLCERCGTALNIKSRRKAK